MTPSASPDATSATPVDAWFELVDAPEAAARSLVRGLGAIGVRLRPRDPGPDRPRNGVIAFARSAAAADHLREVTNGRSERVLALSTSRDALGDDGWGLLRAGASDVFTLARPGALGAARRRATAPLADHRRAGRVPARPGLPGRRQPRMAGGAPRSRRGGPLHRRRGADHR